MLCIRRIAAAAAAWLLATGAQAQTYTSCNPLYTTCPPNTALGMAINVDFTKGPVNSFTGAGSPSYSSDGVSFSVTGPGSAPQLNSVFFIMFGRVEVVMKAAPGAGIVSSLVLQSDDLDEIDFEWLGADAHEVQSNYFGKGNVASYNRGQFHSMAADNQATWQTYVIDWTKDSITWSVGGTVVRTLAYGDAEPNQYPQTPMQVKFGAWSGGDPSNAPGTIAWAKGPTDFSRGPFAMHVRSVAVTDYSTGKQYRYTDNSGSWQSIEAVGGTINANYGKAGQLPVTPTSGAGAAGEAGASVPVGGIATASVTQTGWPWVPTGDSPAATAPSGWVFRPDGKIVPAAAPGGVRPPTLLAILAASLSLGVFSLLRRWI